MYLREHLHDQLDMIAVLSPANPPVLTKLSDAIRDHLRSPSGAPLYRRATSRYSWGRLSKAEVEAAIPTVLHVDEPGLSTAAIAVRVSERGYDTLPLSVVVSGQRIAWMFPHDLFDGASGWEHITDIINRTLGKDDSDQANQAKPYIDFPMFRSLKHSKLNSRAALIAGRAARREAESITSTAPQFDDGIRVNGTRRLTRHRFVTLTAEQLKFIDRTRPATQGHSTGSSRARATRGMRLAEIAIAAFDAASSPTADYRIRMAVDLRRYVPRGYRVAGAFSTAYPVGTLRTTDNSAAALTQRFAGILSRKEPLISLAADLTGVAKNTVRNPRTAFIGGKGDPSRDTVDLTLSVLPCPVPDGFWQPGSAPETATILLHPIEVTGPFIQISEVSGQAVISVWDEPGAIDLAAFESALSSLIAARVAPSLTDAHPASTSESSK